MTGEITTDVSVIIAAHNAEDFLTAQLTALARQSVAAKWEVVVVDNNSTDRTAEIASSFEDRLDIRVVDAFDGRGAGYARNSGVRTTTSDWIVFCDADDVVGDGWLQHMIEALAADEFVAGSTELDRLNEPWVVNSRGRSFAVAEMSFLGIFPAASSCNLGIHRSAFERVAGFDEDFFKGQDLELSLRLWQAGVKMRFEPAAIVHYRLRASRRDLFDQSRNFAMVQPVLSERLRNQGVVMPSRRSRARQWGWLIRELPLLRSKAGQARWLWVAGTQIGRLQGGLRVRRFYL